MIAYEALLACKGNWTELCNLAVFHGSDSDSTEVIAGCLSGVLYGTKDVPRSNFEIVDYRERLKVAGKELFKLAYKNEGSFTNDKEVIPRTRRHRMEIWTHNRP